MLKATAGGGGRGIRMVDARPRTSTRRSSAPLGGAEDRRATPRSSWSARSPAPATSRCRSSPTPTGDVWTLGVRDCSVQRRNQKVIEESASPALDAEQEQLLRASAAALVRAAGYVNAGTVEFLYEPRREAAVVPRGQHPAAGRAPGHRGHHRHRPRQAAAARRRRAAAGGDRRRPTPAGARARHRGPAHRRGPRAATSRPAPGRIEHLALPGGPGIRVDTGVAAGDTIPPQFDSMIAKIIAWGRDRDEARARLSRALRQTTVVIEGGTTNKAFLLDLLDQPEVRRRRGRHQLARHDDGRRLRAAAAASTSPCWPPPSRRRTRTRRGSASGCSPRPSAGRPEVGHETVAPGRRAGGRRGLPAAGGPDPPAAGTTSELDGTSGRRRRRPDRPVRAPARRRRPRRSRCSSAPQGPDYLVEVDGAVHRISGDEAGLVRAPAPGDGRGHPGRGRATRSTAGDVGGRGGEHEAGDGAARPVRRPGARGASSPSTPRWRAARRCCGWSRRRTKARRRSRRASGASAWAGAGHAAAAAARRRSAGRGGGRAGGAAQPVLGYDVDEADARRQLLAR